MLKRILQNSVVLFVLVIILLLIIPLEPALVDVAIVINMAISMMILVITMTIREPLELSIFPSLLLITTLFRLGINVSTTRNILTRGGSSGAIIKAFGDFVVRGNVVVGLIIYLIIVLMQFIVITKGAERVSEVAARFKLDAMPGKQMAIDADLSSGMITEKQARERRQKIQMESDFYGSMDGATKIVKGDGIMSLVTTAINLIGGSIIGIIQSGQPVSTVLSTYSIATVGDGLVAQIPSLLISVSTGMIVTRAVSEGSLNEDVSRQFTQQPRAIMITGIAMMVLVLIPGMPLLQIIPVAGGFIFAGYFLEKRIKDEPDYGRIEGEGLLSSMEEEGVSGAAEGNGEAEAQSEEDYYKDVNNVYNLLQVEPIEMDFGYSLIPLADESVGGRLIQRIVVFRRQYAQDMGFVVPSIRLRDSSGLGTNEYSIKVKGEEIAKGEILTDYMLALEPEDAEESIDGIETIEPAYGIPSKWIRPENRERAELYGYTVIDPLSVMLSHLSETIKRHSYELMTRQEVVRLIENLKKSAPELCEEAFPGVISYNLLQRVLTMLLREGISIKDLETIVETCFEFISESGLPVKDIDQIVEKVRAALKRTITRMYCEDGNMKVVTLDSALERTMVNSLTRGESGLYLALSPELLQSIVRQVAEESRKFNHLSNPPLILTSQVMRIHFYHLIEQFYPNVRVLSFNEVASNVQIQAIGSLRLEEDMEEKGSA